MAYSYLPSAVRMFAELTVEQLTEARDAIMDFDSDVQMIRIQDVNDA